MLEKLLVQKLLSLLGVASIVALVAALGLTTYLTGQETRLPIEAEANCISFNLGQSEFPDYQSSYTFDGTVCNISDGDTQISAFGQESSTYINNISGGLGVQTIVAGDCRTASFTVYMNDTWTKPETKGTVTQAKVYATSRDVGDWGCYADLTKTITFGTACECDPWLDGFLGGWTCAPNERHQYRACIPAGCDIENRCVPTDCSCTNWQDGNCGDWQCASDARHRYRTCTPAGCDVENQCPWDSTCPTPTPTPTVCGSGNCNGCCDPNNTCQPGDTNTACGKNGAQCVNCVQTNNICESTTHTCVAPTVSPTTCNSTNCAGCCLNNVCYQGTSDTQCGMGGNLCTTCPSGYKCTSGSCAPVSTVTPISTITPTPGDSCKIIGDTWVCWIAPGICPGEVRTPPTQDGRCYVDSSSSNACCNTACPTIAAPGNVQIQTAPPVGANAFLAFVNAADINGDGNIDGADASALVSSWGKVAGETGYNRDADLNDDGKVNAVDASILVSNWSK